MVIKKNSELLFTSRSPIPGNKNNEFKTSHKQVCVYAYTFNALKPLRFSRFSEKYLVVYSYNYSLF